MKAQKILPRSTDFSSKTSLQWEQLCTSSGYFLCFVYENSSPPPLALSLSPHTHSQALQPINHDSDLAVWNGSHSLSETCDAAFCLTLPCPTFVCQQQSLCLTTSGYFLPEGGCTWRGLVLRDMEDEKWAPTQCCSGWVGGGLLLQSTRRSGFHYDRVFCNLCVYFMHLKTNIFARVHSFTRLLERELYYSKGWELLVEGKCTRGVSAAWPGLLGAALRLLEEPGFSLFCGPRTPCPFRCSSLWEHLLRCSLIGTTRGCKAGKSTTPALQGLGDTEEWGQRASALTESDFGDEPCDWDSVKA